MPRDAPLNGGAVSEPVQMDRFGAVSEMQTKLHRWAVADPGRRFDDLFNFVCDPATLIAEFARGQYAVAKNVFSMLDNFAWRRVIRMLTVRHRWKWSDVRRQLIDPTGRWLPIAAGGTELRSIAAIPVTRYRYRGNAIPSPWVRQIA